MYIVCYWVVKMLLIREVGGVGEENWAWYIAHVQRKNVCGLIYIIHVTTIEMEDLQENKSVL